MQQKLPEDVTSEKGKLYLLFEMSLFTPSQHWRMAKRCHHYCILCDKHFKTKRALDIVSILSSLRSILLSNLGCAALALQQRAMA
jgi:hypothetical protein